MSDDVRASLQRFVKPRWVRGGVAWCYRPGGIFVRASVRRKARRWTVETSWFRLRGFATLADAKRAAEYLWRYFPAGFDGVARDRR